MWVHNICIWCSWNARGHGISWNCSFAGCELPYGFWELNLDLQEEQHVLLTTAPSLQPPRFYFLYKAWVNLVWSISAALYIQLKGLGWYRTCSALVRAGSEECFIKGLRVPRVLTWQPSLIQEITSQITVHNHSLKWVSKQRGEKFFSLVCVELPRVFANQIREQKEGQKIHC